MDRDGSNLKNLTSDAATQYELAWSPDGRRIAYYSDAPGGRFELFVMDADGGNPRQVTNASLRQRLAPVVAGREPHRLRLDAGRRLGDLHDGRRRLGRRGG